VNVSVRNHRIKIKNRPDKSERFFLFLLYLIEKIPDTKLHLPAGANARAVGKAV